MVMFGEAFKEQTTGTFLTVQRFRFCTSTVGSMASIPGGELRSFMPHSAAKKKKKESRTDIRIQECKEWELWETTPYLGMKSWKSSSQEKE